MHLSEDAIFWWPTCMKGDANRGVSDTRHGKCRKRSWRISSYPQTKVLVTREDLQKLKHTCIACKYVKKLSLLMMEIKNTSREEKMFNFHVWHATMGICREFVIYNLQCRQQIAWSVTSWEIPLLIFSSFVSNKYDRSEWKGKSKAKHHGMEGGKEGSNINQSNVGGRPVKTVTKLRHFHLQQTI